MSREQELIDKVARLREDFASLGDGPFEHFYCPTLLVDEYAELCLGHVVNEAIPNSSRITVPQRKDIDNFYGTLCESCFGPFLKAHALGADAHTILSDPELRRQLPWTVSLNGKAIDCYEYRGNKHPLHPTVEFRDRNGKIFTVALKTTDQLDNAGQFQIVVDRNYTAEVTATLLKAAHLSQFVVLGYQHVFGAAGLMLADILGKFYLQNRDKPRADAIAAMKGYLSEYSRMILPLLGFEPGLLKGTVEDRRFMACVGSSGAWYALGAFVKTDDRMHVVLIPGDTADAVGTYFELIRDLRNKTFVYQLIEFVPGNENERTHWLAGEKQYVFDPRRVA